MPDTLGNEIEVSKLRTTPSEPDLCLALNEASADLLGEPLSRESMSVLVAQIYLETGRLKSCWNWNLGNVRDLPRDGFDFVMLWTWEILNGKRWEGFGAFRAMRDLATGVREHLSFLTNFERRPRYRFVWDQVLKGDPVATARELKARGYYTADEGEYARGMSSLSREFLAKTASVELPTTAPPSVDRYSPEILGAPVDPRGTMPELGDFLRSLSTPSLSDEHVEMLRASHVRGFHRPTHVVDVTAPLQSTEAQARLTRAMLDGAMSRGSIA